MGEAGGDLRVVSMKAGNGWGPWKLGKKGGCIDLEQEFSCYLSCLHLYIHQCTEEEEEALAIGSPGGYQQNSLATKS